MRNTKQKLALKIANQERKAAIVLQSFGKKISKGEGNACVFLGGVIQDGKHSVIKHI